MYRMKRDGVCVGGIVIIMGFELGERSSVFNPVNFDTSISPLRNSLKD